MIKTIILDGYTLNPGDLNWDQLEALTHTTIFPYTAPKDIISRSKTADILVVNKCTLDKNILSQLPNLKYICVSATGYNNVDVEFCKKNKILVSNVSDYSTPSVVQHVFALLFAIFNQVETYHQEVENGVWSNQDNFSYWNFPIQEIYGKVMGIYGFGKIGKAVAKVALAFGMKVISYHKHPERDQIEGVQFVDVDTLLSESDVLSLHAPLNKQSQGIISLSNLKKMKSSAILINTGRGGLVNESDLKFALENEIIKGAGLDVLSQEPPPLDHILIGVKNCIITPHQAWGSHAARQRLLDEVIKNIDGFLKGELRGIINF